jgi:hypothetical protein
MSRILPGFVVCCVLVSYAGAALARTRQAVPGDAQIRQILIKRINTEQQLE